MPIKRRCGILCHPTSLPGRHGIGDLGEGAYQFVQYLARAGQTLWQILPLGPTGYGDSPYQPFSAFAGNPLLICLDPLVARGLLPPEAATPEPSLSPDRVDYGGVIGLKQGLLHQAYRALTTGAYPDLGAELAAFIEREAAWVLDYALFMALKVHFEWVPWTQWPREVALRQPEALAHWRQELADEIGYRCFAQYLFDAQWTALRRAANAAGIQIMGDVPIFVGHDSADVWANQGLFRLDDAGMPTVVAGVPPDYFSATGQLWGNPHYRWDTMKANGYAWWLARLERLFSQVDLVRLDHFRGFSGFWQVPADKETAINGRWVRGPGADFFRAAQDRFGELPIVAEDLGVITSDVDALREQFGLPGMKVLQFAFDSDAGNPDLPHNHTPASVVYTGTHDNDTTIGWFANRPAEIQHKVRTYAGTDGRDINWVLIRMAVQSVAETAIIPLQDVLGLGSEARLNTPGDPAGNWTWRFRAEALTDATADALRNLAIATARYVPPGEELEETRPKPVAYGEP